MLEIIAQVLAESSLEIILALVFATAIFLIGSIGYLFVDETPIVKRRLKAIQQREEFQRKDAHREGAFAVRWVEPAAKIILPESDWAQSRLRVRLVRAGYHGNRALYVYLGVKVLLAIALPLFFVLVSFAAGFALFTELSGLILLVLAALLGYFMPDIYLHMKFRERQRVLREDFPDALDLLVVCVEAGLGLDAALQRVSRELEKNRPEMGLELGMVNLEIRAGKSKEEALRALAERTQLPEVQALTSILIQAEQFGTSVGESLSGHSDDMRNVRIQNARERAAKLPVKLVFPVMLFIFPALFLILLGPAVMNIIAGFGAVLG